MLTLNRRQITVLLLIVVSFIAVLAASLAVLHAVDPALWRHAGTVLPDINSHY